MREMDYKKEAYNGVQFRQLYGGIQEVVVPDMYMEQTTSKVLVMQWVEGQKLAGVKDLYIIEVGVYCSFNQLLERGFYHADPHPGNLLQTYDGKLAYLDFGMMGEFKEELRDGFMEACLHLVNRDYDVLAKDFATLGLLPATADKDSVTIALTGVFRSAVSRGISSISFGDLLGNLGTTMYNFKFRIPSYFSLVIRRWFLFSGIAIGVNPDYKVLGSIYPWIVRKVLTDSSPKLKSSLQALLYKSLRARTESVLVKKQAEDHDSKIVIKQLVSFALDEMVQGTCNSVMTSGRNEETRLTIIISHVLLFVQGAFVSEIILEEFAKGLDALGLATLDSLTSRMTPNLPFRPSNYSSSMTAEDNTNLRTFQRLMVLISGFQQTETSDTGGVGAGSHNIQKPSSKASLLYHGLISGLDLFPLLSVVAELPQDSQQRLLHLPADLAGKLVSRVAARTMKRVFL